MHLCHNASFLFAIINLYATSPLPPLEASSRGVFLAVFHLQPFYESTSFRIAYAIRVYRIFSLLSRIIIKLHQDIDLVSRNLSYSSDDACIHSSNDSKQPFLYYDLTRLDLFTTLAFLGS